LRSAQVTFVGIIRNLARNATNISYNIDDGTGMVDVRVWSDNASSELMEDNELQ
jgi:replication factor A2